MNLELLDPFRRQIPDRVDSTLSLPSGLHPISSKQSQESVLKSKPQEADDEKSTASGVSSPKISSGLSSPKNAQDDDQAAYHVAFNRRGSYLAVGHAKGTVAVHDFMSRTLSALYRPPEEGDVTFPYGVTSVTWSRRSRTLLAGAVGDTQVRLFDTTHPLGPEDCCPLFTEDGSQVVTSAVEGTTSPAAAATTNTTVSMPSDSPKQIATTTSPSPDSSDDMARQPRVLTEVKEIPVSTQGTMTDLSTSTLQERHEAALKKMRESESSSKQRTKRYATLLWSLPEPVGGSLQVHPKLSTAGLAVLQSGALILFRVPPSAFESYPLLETEPVVKYVTLYEAKHVTSAAFDAHGDKVYAASKDGVLLGFEVAKLCQSLLHTVTSVQPVSPSFEITVPGGATVWHLQVSRNSKLLLLNCADSALRLYNTADCWSQTDTKPSLVFQDVVSKAPFASCDFSGDAEYVVGGCNGNDDKYELYLWNTATGALMDRLTGAQVSLYSVAWHPTRSFLAVATSDGLVDIWGPRMDWTAFAPDFQALPMNVEYVEREDEFDVVVDNNTNTNESNEKDDNGGETMPVVEQEEDVVDVVTVEPVPVFASDSESESEVFYFDTKIKNIMAGRGRNSWGAGKPAVLEEKE